MPTPADVVWDADPHTLAKHRLLQAYLAAWLPTLLHGGYDRVTYAEGFAGPGIYRGGEPGSPVAALRAFLGQRRLLAGGRTVSMVLAEKDHRRMTELRRQMGRALTEAPVAPAGISVEYVCGDHAKVLLPALERIGAMRRPVFAFLDSYGGPDVPLDVARRIGSAPASEVLVTFGTSFFIRFCEVEGHQAEGDRVFGGPQWRQVAKLAPREKKPFLVATYRRSLRQAGFRFVLSFEMLDEQGHDLHLVFGTTHRAGLEKMKDAMWAIDPIGGVRFRDPRDPSQGMLDFTINPDFGAIPDCGPRSRAPSNHTPAARRPRPGGTWQPAAGRSWSPCSPGMSRPGPLNGSLPWSGIWSADGPMRRGRPRRCSPSCGERWKQPWKSQGPSS
jgi:three-Cys-motif partner protein